MKMMEMPACRLFGRLLCFALFAVSAMCGRAAADGSASFPKTTLVQDVVYRADGSPATGWIVISWPAFVTSDGAAVAAGSTSVKLGSDGRFSVALAPNAGATPAGSYYAVTLKLDGGATSKETWLVPTASPANLSGVRASAAPATMAVQALTADWANGNLVNLSGAQAIAGVKSFAQSPSVPTPLNANDAANKAYVDANAGGGVNVARINSVNTWTQPQAFGSSCPQPANGIGAASVNGVLNAACFSGNDWAAKTASAIAALPSGGGTVFIQSLLAGGTSSNGINVPANVNLEFDSGTYTLGGALTINGAGHRIEGKSSTATTLQFAGATDGVVFPDAGPIEKRTVIENLSLVATNAGGGKAFNAWDATTIPPTTIVMRNVKITAAGSGAWAYGFYTSNMQFCGFYDVTITGNVAVGLHLENGTNEDVFVNVFVINGGRTRAAEFYGGSINSDELTFINGGFQGSGGVYVTGGSWVYMLGTHFEAITPTGSDAAAVVVDNGNLRWSSTNGAVSLSAKNGADVKVVTSQLGDVTIDSTAMGSIVNSSMRSIANNSNNFALFGNSLWSSGAMNTLTVGQFTLSNSAPNGQVVFSRLGTAGLAITQGAGARITIGSGFGLGWATSGVSSEDTYLTRGAAGTLRLGTSNGGTDGTLLLGKIAGTGNATFTAGPAAGTLPGAPSCAAGHVCDSYSGTVNFTVGTSTTTGTLLTVTTGVTRSNTPNCMVQAYLSTSPYTALPLRDAGSTTTVVFSTGVAPTPSAAYELKYVCPGS